MQDGEPVLLREAELHFFNDKEGKPVAINDLYWTPPDRLPSATRTAISRCRNG
jgi:hypothetical protein